MCIPRFCYDEVPPNSSTLLREHRAAATIQHAYRGHRKRQAAARKIQNFMRQSRIKLRKMHELSEGVCTMASEQSVEVVGPEGGVSCLQQVAAAPVSARLEPLPHHQLQLHQMPACSLHAPHPLLSSLPVASPLASTTTASLLAGTPLTHQLSSNAPPQLASLQQQHHHQQQQSPQLHMPITMAHLMDTTYSSTPSTITNSTISSRPLMGPPMGIRLREQPSLSHHLQSHPTSNLLQRDHMPHSIINSHHHNNNSTISSSTPAVSSMSITAPTTSTTVLPPIHTIHQSSGNSNSINNGN